MAENDWKCLWDTARKEEEQIFEPLGKKKMGGFPMRALVSEGKDLKKMGAGVLYIRKKPTRGFYKGALNVGSGDVQGGKREKLKDNQGGIENGV